jgi:hypothetical protein
MGKKGRGEIRSLPYTVFTLYSLCICTVFALYSLCIRTILALHSARTVFALHSLLPEGAVAQVVAETSNPDQLKRVDVSTRNVR